MKNLIRSHFPPKAVTCIKNIRSLFLYPFHAFQLAIQILFYRLKNRSPRFVLCIANPASVGGAELQLEIVAEYLKKRLGECLLLVSGQAEERDSSLFLARFRALDIPILFLGQVGLACPPSLVRGKAWLLRFVAPQGTVCHFFNPASVSLAPAAKAAHYRVVYTEVGMPAQNEWWGGLYQGVPFFDSVTSVSDAGLRSLRDLFGYRGPGFKVPSMIRPHPRPVQIKSRPNRPFHIVYFGRMSPNKGGDLLLTSLKSLPGARLSLIGNGESLPHLKKMAKELEVEGRVEFIHWLRREDLFRLLGGFDLFCLPSQTEGMPSSIIEAMSIGLPVLASDVGGVSEIIEHEVSGILIPPCDQAALTEALTLLSKDPALLRRLGRAAKKRWKKFSDQETLLKSLMMAYGI